MMVMDEIFSIKVHTRAEVEAMTEEAKVELILALESRLFALESRVKELEARVGLNSRNSSKPPSSPTRSRGDNASTGGDAGSGREAFAASLCMRVRLGGPARDAGGTVPGVRFAGTAHGRDRTSGEHQDLSGM